MFTVRRASLFIAAALMLAASSGAFAADDGTWTVSKSSGEVWLSSEGAQPASLKQDESLKPGDTVRTGRNGRVLLQRGEETILISPNSVVGLPAAAKDGLATTILQQAGSILLEVEKRNVKHFEVETPYLAAVVKGTQFRVTVGAASTSVDVVRGQVEVADFRSGQIAQVMPGQHATTFAQGKTGLALSGSGAFNPIEQGKPRTPSIERVPVPKGGLSLPRNAANTPTLQRATPASAGHGVMHLSASLGEVRLNFNRVTHGLARDNSPASGTKQKGASADTIWSSAGSGTTGGGSGSQNTFGNVASGSGNATSGAGTASVASVTAAVVGAAGSGGNGGSSSGGGGGGNGGGGGGGGGNQGNGNGNNGNGNNNNANGNGNNGNHYGHGHSLIGWLLGHH